MDRPLFLLCLFVVRMERKASLNAVVLLPLPATVFQFLWKVTIICRSCAEAGAACLVGFELKTRAYIAHTHTRVLYSVRSVSQQQSKPTLALHEARKTRRYSWPFWRLKADEAEAPGETLKRERIKGTNVVPTRLSFALLFESGTTMSEPTCPNGIIHS